MGQHARGAHTQALAQQLGLDAGTPFKLTPAKRGLLVEPLRQRRRAYTLSDLLAQCKGPNPHREAVTGQAGREVF